MCYFIHQSFCRFSFFCISGKSITGEEAERIGMVSLCVEEAELYDTALDTAQTIIANSPSAVRWSKHSINGWLRMMGPNFDHSLALEMLGFKLPDIQEGLAAMQEKRPTNFNQNCPL